MSAWPVLDESSGWIAGAAWFAWFLTGNGRVRLSPAERNVDQGTFRFAWGLLLGSLGLAVLLAASWPSATIQGPPWVPRIAGACIAGFGIALREWAVRTLGESFTQVVALRADQPLVTSGPYRYVRHPGYSGTLLTLVGLGLTLGSWGSVAVLAVGALVAHLPRMGVEERALEEQFGDAYREYERTHRRLIPRVW